MKILLEIDDTKGVHLLEVLKQLPNVSIQQLDNEPSLLDEVQEAIEELKLIKEGKKEAKDAQAFLDEL